MDWRGPDGALQEQAFEESQKYKEGKFIVEKLRMMCNEGWV